MSKPPIDEPRIRFSIAGIIALCVSENKREFDVGVVRTIASSGDIPGHVISMEIKKDGAPTPIRYDRNNIPKQSFLRVIGQPPSVGIQFHAPGNFDRNLRVENHHFKWTLDVGNGELHSGVVTINPAAIRSVLHVSGVESAIFYTDNLSRKKLKIKDRPGGPREFGFIAGTIEALIPLPRDGAEFFEGNGGAQYTLRYEKDVTYDITIKQTCSTVKDCSEVNAEEVYRDLFRTGIPGKEINIIGMDHKRTKKTVTPEIGCVGVNFSANGKLP